MPLTMHGGIGTKAVAVTKSDTVRQEGILYVGGAGDVKVTTIEGDVVTFVGVPAGTILPVFVILVWSAVTTATSMVLIT